MIVTAICFIALVILVSFERERRAKASHRGRTQTLLTQISQMGERPLVDAGHRRR